MKRLTMTLAAAFALAGLVIGGNTLAAKGKDAPEKVTISDCKAKQPVVAFDHKKHFTELKVACDECHHTQKGLTDKSADEVKKCGDCHMPGKDPKAPSCQEMGAAKNPFHIKCLGCHKQKGGEAPVKCAGCHVKK